MALNTLLENKLGKAIKEATNREIYEALLTIVKDMAEERTTKAEESKKKIYYVSAEFLIGKLLSNNMINLGIYDEVKELLAANGKNLAAIEDVRYGISNRRRGRQRQINNTKRYTQTFGSLFCHELSYAGYLKSCLFNGFT